MTFFVLCLLSVFYFCYRLIVVIVVSFLLSFAIVLCLLSFMIWISFLLLLSIIDNNYADLFMYKR